MAPQSESSLELNGQRSWNRLLNQGFASSAKTVIVVSDHAYVSGGNAQVGIASAIELANQGMRVIIFAAVGPIDERLVSRQNPEVVCLNQMEARTASSVVSGAMQGLWNGTAAQRLKIVLRSLDPKHTVVHVHSWTKGLSPSVLRAARDGGFPIVVTLHDYFSICPNGSYYIHPKQQPCTLKPMSAKCMLTNCDPRNYQQKMYRVGRQVITRMLGGMPIHVRHFISISKQSRATIEPYLRKDAIIYDVCNPVVGIKPVRATVSRNDEYFFVGRLSKEKGPALFLDAAVKAGVKAVVIGDGPEIASLQKRHPEVTFTGWLHELAVRDRLRSARALVMPSMWEEPFGLVALEALALGIPAVVPADSGARQHVVDGYNGFVFKRANVVDLAEKMSILKHDGLADTLGRAAYDRYWRDPLSVERHTRQLIDVYERVLAA